MSASSRNRQLQPKKAANGPQARTASGTQEFQGFYRRHLKVLLPITLVIAFFCLFGIYDTVSSWGKIHHGVYVQGIDVGGKTVSEAAEAIEAGLSDVVEEASFTIYEGSSSDASTDSSVDTTLAWAEGSDSNEDGKTSKWKVNADTIGASVDGEALANGAYVYGREGNFVLDRMASWLFPKNYNAVISYNEESFTGLVDDINDTIGTKIKNSKATVEDGKATLKEGRDGWLVDEDALVKSLSTVFFDADASYCVIPMHTVPMYVQPETAQKVVDQINSVISSDVSIVYGSSTWTMDSTDLGNVISQKVLEPGEYLTIGNGTQKVETGDRSQAVYDMSTGTDAASGYALQAYVNQKAFDSYLVDLLGDKATGGAKNARFVIKNGKVKIKKSVTGTGPDRVSAEIALQDMLFGKSASGAGRTVTLVDTTVEPDITTEEAKNMGVKEKLSTWSIPLSGSSSRIKNIKLLCKIISGSLVAPGDTWSFNETTGERTAAKGFETAPVIVGGRHEDQLGGGICQVATCVFNSACYAGLGIGTRSNHAFYISSYDDKGFADATVSWEEPDLQWINDTDNYILLTATVDDENCTVSLWGTDDGRKVTCDRGKWKEGTKYKTIKEKTSELKKGQTKVTQTGRDGRSIYIRYLVTSKSGETLHDIKFHSVYSAQNEIIQIGTG